GVDAGGARSGLALTDGAQFEAPDGFGEEKPNAHGSNDCKRQREADGRAAEPSELMNQVISADAAGLGILSFRILEQVNRDVAGETGGDEIEHDGVNDLVTIAAGSKPTGNCTPKRAGENGGERGNHRR